MKIKLIALAAAALVSGAANATLYTAQANTNEMFLNVWNANGSYTQDLGITSGAFLSATPTFSTLSVALNDAAFAAFIATGTAFSWDITGANAVGNFTTITTLNGAAPALAPLKSVVSPEAGGINQFAVNIDSAVAQGTIAGQQVVAGTAIFTQSPTSPTYAGLGAVSDTAYTSYNAVGTEANNSFASGLGFLKIVAPSTGLPTVRSTQTLYSNTVAYMSSSNGAYVLNVSNVAAVPEADSLAMLLAGLGMVGSIVARRSRKV
jgi:hypothetical protein